MSDTSKSTPKPTAPEKPPLALRYVGGGATLPDLPARDLTFEEWPTLVQLLIERSGAATTDAQPAQSAADIRTSLITSGLYEKVGG